VGLVVVIVGLWFMLQHRADFTNVPLAQSPFLRDVAEPITIIKGPHETKSDSVWMGVDFTDAKHVERSAAWYITVYIPSGVVHDTLVLGQKTVPAYGPDERAFLGLLQRWYRRDAEARQLREHPTREEYSALTEQQRAKITGVSIMRKLLARN
jgi:hypothetical protein